MPLILINFDGMTDDRLMEAFARMKMEHLSNSVSRGSLVDLSISKVKQHYKATLNFVCTDFTFNVSFISKRPYKAIEQVSCFARDEILQRAYQSCGYV